MLTAALSPAAARRLLGNVAASATLEGPLTAERQVLVHDLAHRLGVRAAEATQLTARPTEAPPVDPTEAAATYLAAAVVLAIDGPRPGEQGVLGGLAERLGIAADQAMALQRRAQSGPGALSPITTAGDPGAPPPDDSPTLVGAAPEEIERLRGAGRGAGRAAANPPASDHPTILAEPRPAAPRPPSGSLPAAPPPPAPRPRANAARRSSDRRRAGSDSAGIRGIHRAGEPTGPTPARNPLAVAFVLAGAAAAVVIGGLMLFDGESPSPGRTDRTDSSSGSPDRPKISALGARYEGAVDRFERADRIGATLGLDDLLEIRGDLLDIIEEASESDRVERATRDAARSFLDAGPFADAFADAATAEWSRRLPAIEEAHRGERWDHALAELRRVPKAILEVEKVKTEIDAVQASIEACKGYVAAANALVLRPEEEALEAIIAAFELIDAAPLGPAFETESHARLIRWARAQPREHTDHFFERWTAAVAHEDEEEVRRLTAIITLLEADADAYMKARIEGLREESADPAPEGGASASFGTGFWVDARHVVAALRTVESAHQVEVQTPTGERLAGTVLDRHAELGVVLIAVDVGDREAPAGSTIAVAPRAAAIGDNVWLGGFTPKDEDGIKMVLVEVEVLDVDEAESILVYDVFPATGMGGAPLLDRAGRWVGLVRPPPPELEAERPSIGLATLGASLEAWLREHDVEVVTAPDAADLDEAPGEIVMASIVLVRVPE